MLAKSRAALAFTPRRRPSSTSVNSASPNSSSMEKVKKIVVVEARFDWDDLGSWEAVYNLGDKDEHGNVIQGDVLAIDCRDCLLISKGGKLSAVGLSGMGFGHSAWDQYTKGKGDNIFKILTVSDEAGTGLKVWAGSTVTVAKI